MNTFVYTFVFWVVFVFDLKVVEDVTDFSNLVFLILLLFLHVFFVFVIRDEASL